MRALLAGLVFVFLAVLVIPQSSSEDRSIRQDHTDRAPLSVAQELQMKRTILKTDAIRTQQLCTSHCFIRMNHFFKALPFDNESIHKELASIQKDHPHLQWVAYSKMGSNQTTQIGSPSQKAQFILSKIVSKPFAWKKDRYVSDIYKRNGHPYKTLALLSPDKASVLVVEVEMKLVSEVKQHQRKNLRLTEFPSKGKYGVKTVDDDTLQEKNVNSPEDNEGTSHYKKSEIVVKFKGTPSAKQISKMEQDIAGEMVKQMGPVHIFQSERMSTKEMMDYFANQGGVEYAEPHYIYITNGIEIVPNDQLYNEYQWNLPTIDTEKGWDISRGAKEVVIAVIDTGVDLDHPEFKGKLVEGYNFINPEKKPYDDVGHGTHVAGIIGASTNNGEGIAGVTWYNKIMPIKVLDSSGTGSTYDVAQGIIWATDNGADIINLSLGNYADAQFLHDAVKYAYERDVVLVAATGNDFTAEPGYPAAYPEVIAVGATDENGKLAPFSNYGNYVDVTAPGVNIPSTYPKNQYAALSGTSMAGPHVAGLIGLIRAYNPEVTNAEMKDLIRKTAMDLGNPGYDPYYGAGQINIVAALQRSGPTPPPLFKWAYSQWERIQTNLFKNIKKTG